MKQKTINAFLFLLFATTISFAQEVYNMKGQVVGEQNGLPIPGVNVIILGSNSGTTTDFDGNYEIKVKSGDVLKYSYLGYKSQQITIKAQKSLNISLKEDQSVLDEVVVIGYGSSLRKDLTSAVSVVDVSEIQTGQTPQFEQMLTGRVAGVNISSTDSSPGAGLKIRIRGNNSINGDNEPLLVIDGVLGGSFESLNMNDVQSLQVLKDASATAIYGSQGANGVIIVTTKQGTVGEKLAIDFYSSTGVQKVRKRFDLITADEQIEIFNNDPDFIFPDDVDGVDNPILSGRGTDWQDEIFQTANYNNYHLNLRGGSKNFKGFLSLDYLNQEGVVKQSDYNRISGRSNVTYKASDKFSITHNLSMYKTSSNQIRTNSNFGSGGGPVTTNALYFSPVVPVFAEDGTYNGPLNSGVVRDNPVSLINNLDDLFETTYVQNTILTNWKITNNITHDFSANYTNSTYSNKRYASKVLLRSLNLGEAFLDNIERNSWQIKNLITYRKTFSENHNFSILLGNEIIEDTRFRSQVTAQGFATEVGGYNNIGIADEVTGVFSDETSFGLVSFFSRLTYGYKSKYLFSLSARADGSTKFAENNKWGYFPSGSLAWVVSEEPFLAESKVVNFLKFRASYGETGSQAINPYQSLASYQTGLRYSTGDQDLINGVIVNRVANTNLKWETTSQFDFGIELELFDGNFGLIADYYKKTTTDLLFNRRLGAFTGIQSQIQNVGELENKGYELGVNAQIVDKVFKWDASANISFIDNKVISLGGDNEIFISPPSSSRGNGFNTSGIIQVGKPIGNFYGVIADGIFKTQADIDAIDQPGAVLGTVRYKDISGPDGVPDGKIDDDDRTIIGNALPDYTFGMTNNLSYKNFELNITLQGSIGQDAIRFDKGRILTRDRFDGWSVDNPDSDIPINNNLGIQTNSNYVEDASFVKFKNISLGYTLPESSTSKFGISALRIYVSAIDAIVITDYTGFDPEVNSFSGGDTFQQNVALGYDSGAYPGVSQYLLGLNISF